MWREGGHTTHDDIVVFEVMAREIDHAWWERYRAELERRSGNEDNPRILQAFNEKTPDWLSFFMFTYFTDRDGKYQLAALCERRRDTEALEWADGNRTARESQGWVPVPPDVESPQRPVA